MAVEKGTTINVGVTVKDENGINWMILLNHTVVNTVIVMKFPTAN